MGQNTEDRRQSEGGGSTVVFLSLLVSSSSFSVFLSVSVTHYSLLGFGASKRALPLVLVLSFSPNLAKVVLDSERSAGNGSINGKRI
jgi:hypothetical protein